MHKHLFASSIIPTVFHLRGGVKDKNGRVQEAALPSFHFAEIIRLKYQILESVYLVAAKTLHSTETEATALNAK